MKKIFILPLFLLAFALLSPARADAASPAEAHLGKILLDVSSHGEAWYVNPQTHMRVYLGRPDEALERLKERSIFVNYFHIERLAETAGADSDQEYGKLVAGQVLTPNDLVGASWYVDPVSGLRKRLATADDAWTVMKAGTPANAATLAAIPVENAPQQPRTEVAAVKAVTSADTLELESGVRVRLLNIDVPSNPPLQQAAMARLSESVMNKTVMLERDVDDREPGGVKLRYVHVGASNLNYDLVREGLAFHNIVEPNYRYAEMLIVGAIDAARLKRGFWDPNSPR